MAISNITYTAPGSNDSKNIAIKDGTDVEEFLEDYLDISGNVSVTRNGELLSDFGVELEDGDVIVVSTKKHSSGVTA
jgi:HJR/Mrr/RecB family endonuclease